VSLKETFLHLFKMVIVKVYKKFLLYPVIRLSLRLVKQLYLKLNLNYRLHPAMK
jgi:hypothetical protein